MTADEVHVMLDLETMGIDSNAAVIAIGAVVFDTAAGVLGSEFYSTVALESAARFGAIDASTVLWWLQQSEKARYELTDATTPLPTALTEFSAWCAKLGPPKALRMWGNGAAFDNVILRNAYKAVGLECPWKYNGDRCYRTYKAMFPNVLVSRQGGADE